MKKNLMFRVIFLTLVLSASVFTYNSLSKLYKTINLDKTSPVKNLSVKPKALSDEQWILISNYNYLTYEGEEKLDTSVFKNEWAAQEEAKKLEKNTQWVWYDSHNPQISSLQKNMPTKQIIYTLILWGLVAYFWILNLIMKSREGSGR